MFGGSMNLMCHHPTISMFLTEVNYIIVRKNGIYVGHIILHMGRYIAHFKCHLCNMVFEYSMQPSLQKK